MPSFDVVSKVDLHELTNAVDQSNREIDNRFDFKGSDAVFELSENNITMKAPNDFQLQQMLDILKNKLTKRGIDILCLDVKEAQVNLSQATQLVVVQQGLESTIAKQIVKLIKDKKLKVQAAIQGDQVRVTGKKRDDLQEVIAFLKTSQINMPLQYENFRD